MTEYALYKGETCLSIGTIAVIAKELNISPETVKYYSRDSYKKRLSKRKVKNARELVKLEDDVE